MSEAMVLKAKKLHRRYQVLSCAMGIAIMAGVWCAYENLIPVGKVGDDIIFSYELRDYQERTNAHDIKRIASDIAFYDAIESLGISVDEEQVDAELEKTYKAYGGKEQFDTYIIDLNSSTEDYKDSIRKGLYKSAAIDFYKTQVNEPEQDDIMVYCAEHELLPENFNLDDYKEDKANELYNEYIKKVSDDVKIIIYGD